MTYLILEYGLYELVDIMLIGGPSLNEKKLRKMLEKMVILAVLLRKFLSGTLLILRNNGLAASCVFD
ncbi:MAG: hypothetical protein QXX51_03025 [Candidatus Bathyarchaeia archaeon]